MLYAHFKDNLYVPVELSTLSVSGGPVNGLTFGVQQYDDTEDINDKADDKHKIFTILLLMLTGASLDMCKLRLF